MPVPSRARDVARGDPRLERDGLAHGAGEPGEGERMVGARPGGGRAAGAQGFGALRFGALRFGGGVGCDSVCLRLSAGGRRRGWRRLALPLKQRLVRGGAGESNAKLGELAHHAQVPCLALVLRLGGREGGDGVQGRRVRTDIDKRGTYSYAKVKAGLERRRKHAICSSSRSGSGARRLGFLLNRTSRDCSTVEFVVTEQRPLCSLAPRWSRCVRARA